MKGFLYCLLILLVFGLTSCQKGGTSSAVPTDLVGFTTTKIAGGNAIKAVKNDASGQILEEGILINGVKNGSWITYYPNKEKVIKTLANYVDNQLNGVYLTFTDRSQIETLTTYADGVFDGNYAKFRFGNLEESANYVNGQKIGRAHV